MVIPDAYGLDEVKQRTQFDLLVPVLARQSLIRELYALPAETFRPRWAGYATAKRPYTPHQSTKRRFHQYMQIPIERAEDYHYKAYLSTRDGDEVAALAEEFPKRWHVEEFYNAEQALGWDRAGTCNLNIRYRQMSLALIAQAAIHQFRKRVGPLGESWDSEYLAKPYLSGLEGRRPGCGQGDRPCDILQREGCGLLENSDAGLPKKLGAERIDPHIP
jgi:hypothetical protein